VFPFNYRHYVSSLRAKQGEFLALRNLTTAQRENVTPLWEIQPIPGLEPRDEADLETDTEEGAEEGVDDDQGAPAAPHGLITVDEYLKRMPVYLGRAWRDGDAFVDVALIHPAVRMADGSHPLEWLCNAAAAEKTKLIPVTGLDRTPEHNAAAVTVHNAQKSGIAIRLAIERVSDAAELTALIGQLGLPPEELDLIVDLRVVTPATSGLIALVLPLVLSQLCTGRVWRTFTLLGGSFPEALAPFGRGIIMQPRPEWALWYNLVAGTAERPARLPAFGDYAVQYPLHVTLPDFAAAAAAIRYTGATQWYIFRGRPIVSRGNVVGYGYGQYKALAELCVATAPPYRGPAYSAGDKYIDECANGGPTGNNTTWRSVGTNQHVAFAGASAAAVP
jgi:Beta protein